MRGSPCETQPSPASGEGVERGGTHRTRMDQEVPCYTKGCIPIKKCASFPLTTLADLNGLDSQSNMLIAPPPSLLGGIGRVIVFLSPIQSS
jgi:hypothetical protein